MPLLKPGESPPGSGLYCFKDKDRACTSECMAFVSPPDEPDYKGQQWAHCLELVNIHRTGKHLCLLALQGHQAVKLLSNDVAGRARTQQTPPPVVR